MPSQILYKLDALIKSDTNFITEGIHLAGNHITGAEPPTAMYPHKTSSAHLHSREPVH